MDADDATLVWAGTASPKTHAPPTHAHTTGFGMPKTNKEEAKTNKMIRYDSWDEGTAHLQGPSSPTAASPKASTTPAAERKPKNGKHTMTKRASRIDDFTHSSSLLSMDDGGVSHGDPYA